MVEVSRDDRESGEGVGVNMKGTALLIAVSMISGLVFFSFRKTPEGIVFRADRHVLLGNAGALVARATKITQSDLQT